MHVYIACFDISDDTLRRRVSRRLEHFGLRIQRSVFEISVRSNDQLKCLQEELAQWLTDEANDEDDLRFYPLCRSCRQQACNHEGERVAQFPAAVVL